MRTVRVFIENGLVSFEALTVIVRAWGPIVRASKVS